VFDDTFPHEVWNETDDLRVVLLIQFRRPVRLPGRLLGAAFLAGVRHSPFVQEARRNLQAALGPARPRLARARSRP